MKPYDFNMRMTKAQKEGRNLSTVKGMGGGNHGGAYTRAKGKK